eukprot:7385800-Prymnesium_polylepis.1
MRAAVWGVKCGVSIRSAWLSHCLKNLNLRKSTRLMMVFGDIAWALATRRILGTRPATHNRLAPMTSCNKSIVSPKNRKNRNTPCGSSPKPYVAHTAFAMCSASRANIDEDERQLNQHHQHAVLGSFEWLDREVNRNEDDTHENRNEDTQLFKLLANNQHPPGKSQFAAHLDRLPPNCTNDVVPREKGCRAAQWRWHARANGVTAAPEEQDVHNRDTHRPENDE